LTPIRSRGKKRKKKVVDLSKKRGKVMRGKKDITVFFQPGKRGEKRDDWIEGLAEEKEKKGKGKNGRGKRKGRILYRREEKRKKKGWLLG